MKNLLPQRREMHGFSLIELIVVLVIIGLLQQLAVASYGSVVQRNQRHRIQMAMHNYLMEQDIYQLTYGEYANEKTLPLPQAEGYQVALLIEDNTVTVTAAKQSIDGAEKCATLSLNSQGTASPLDCW